MVLLRLLRPLDRFFFEPMSTLPIALYRLLFGFFLCHINFVLLAPDLLSWYGTHGVVSIDSVLAYYFRSQPHIDMLLLFPQQDAVVVAFFAVYCVASVCLMLGFMTRTSALIVFLGLCTLHHHNPFNKHAGESFMRLVSLFLVFSPAGACLSIDRLIKSLREDWRETGLEPDRGIPWAQRMIQLQLSLLYTQATYVKSIGPEWQDGSALYYASRLDDFIRFHIPFLFDTPWLWQFLTWSALAVEFSLGLLVWIRPLTYWILLGGVGLHLGIDLAMNIPVFEWLMIIAYILFIEPHDLERSFRVSRDLITSSAYRQQIKEYLSSRLRQLRTFAGSSEGTPVSPEVPAKTPFEDDSAATARGATAAAPPATESRKAPAPTCPGEQEPARRKHAPVLFFDGAALASVRIAGLVQRLDVLDLVEVADVKDKGWKQTARELGIGKEIRQLCILYRGRLVTGFGAFVLLCRYMPLSYLVLPLFYLPVTTFLSRLAFEAVWKRKEAIFGRPPRQAPHRALTAVKLAAVILLAVILLDLNIHESRRPISRPNLYAQIVRERERQAQQELKEHLQRPLGLDDYSEPPVAEAQGEAQTVERTDKVLRNSDIKKLLSVQNKSVDAAKIVKLLELQDAENPNEDFPEQRLKTVSRLADVYWQANRLKEANQLLSYVWSRRGRRVKTTGQYDPELFATMLAVGNIYRDWGWFDRAIAAYQRALEYQLDRGPAAEPTVMRCKSNLALIYYLAGQSTVDAKPRNRYYENAQILYLECLPHLARRYGMKDDRYLNVRRNYRLLLRDWQDETGRDASGR